MEDGISGGLQHCHKMCCEKGGRCGRRTCRVQRWHHRGDVVFRTGGLAYDKDLIELRATEEMVPRRFHKYLKVFEKKNSERMPMRKT